jgi:protein Mpv17
MTMMVTNAILGGIADTVAQTITSFRHRSQQLQKASGDGNNGNGLSIEMPDFDRKGQLDTRDFVAPDTRSLPPPFDFERLTRFMAYGFCMAPLQFKWFKFLERIFPITKTSAFGPALKRVAFDQLIFAPFGVGMFFTAMTVAEGGGRRAVANKLRDMYVPTLKANFVVWPAIQIVNFRLMPVQYQLVSAAESWVLSMQCIDNTFTALCLHCQYCLDRLSLSDERCRRRRFQSLNVVIRHGISGRAAQIVTFLRQLADRHWMYCFMDPGR